MENENSIDVILLVVAGCLGMLILVVSIILFVIYYQKKVLAQQNQMQVAENKYQRQLLSAAIQVEEKERGRIAKNIHDDVGTLLNVLKLNLSKASRHVEDKVMAHDIEEENLKLLEESIQSIRGIAKDLVPPTLVKLGYIKALNELCRHINNSGSIKVNFFQKDPAIRLPEQTELQLYRLTQELINNIIKHSGAKEISIEFKKFNSAYNLMLIHNGKGITSEQVKEFSKEGKGLGLKSIQSRAQLINATVTYKVQNDHVASTTIELPYE